MLGILLLIVGLGLAVSCAACRPTPARAWLWWTGLCGAICALAAGCALWQIDATLYGMDVFARWGGRAIVALAGVFVAWMYVGRRARKREGRSRWGWMRSAAAVVALGAMLAGAWVVGSIPWIRRDGWWAAVPTTVLIVGMDVLPMTTERELIDRVLRSGRVNVNQYERRDVAPWQSEWLMSRLRARISSELSVEAIDAASTMADEFDDEFAAKRMCDLAFRALVSGDEELQIRAAPIVRWEVLWYKTRWMYLGGPYLEQHGEVLLPGLIRTLESPHDDVRHAALRAIERMGTAAYSATPAVMRAMSREPAGWWQHCGWDALEAIGADLAPLRAQRLAALRSSEREVRMDALARACWSAGTESECAGLFEGVLERLREGDLEEARIAAKAAVHLSAYDRGFQKPLLLDLLLSEAQRRGDSAAMLAEVSNRFLGEVSSESLVSLLSHEYAPLRMAAVQAMRQRLGSSDSGRWLAERMLAEVARSDPDAAIRAAASAGSPFVETRTFEVDAD